MKNRQVNEMSEAEEGKKVETLPRVSDAGTSSDITSGNKNPSDDGTWDSSKGISNDADNLDDSEVVDPAALRSVAMAARITELKLDDVIRYRADELFPSNPQQERRDTMYSIYGDVNFHRAMRIVSRNHNGMAKSGIRFIAFSVGIMRLVERFGGEYSQIEGMRSRIDNDGKASDGLSMLPEMSLDQQSKVKQVKTGFTKANAEWVEDVADNFGITISSILLFAFWDSVITCDNLPSDLVEYGTKICDQFKTKVAMRKAMLAALVASI